MIVFSRIRGIRAAEKRRGINPAYHDWSVEDMPWHVPTGFGSARMCVGTRLCFPAKRGGIHHGLQNDIYRQRFYLED